MARKPRKTIADAELEVLQVLWDLRRGTVRDLLGRLPEGRAYTTIQTLVTRLEAKGFVAKARDGRALVYTPRIERDELLSVELDDVATRVTGGNTSPLVLNLVERSDLTPNDIAELRAMLDRMDPPNTK